MHQVTLIYSLKDEWSQMNVWPPWKTIGITYSLRGTSLKFKQLSLLEISCLQCFKTLTTVDLWPPWTTIGIIYSLWGTYIPSLKFRQLLLLEISCLQSFNTLNSVDLKWPLTSMNNNRDHLLTMGYLHTKFEVQATLYFLRYRVYKPTCHIHKHIHTQHHHHIDAEFWGGGGV